MDHRCCVCEKTIKYSSSYCSIVKFNQADLPERDRESDLSFHDDCFSSVAGKDYFRTRSAGDRLIEFCSWCGQKLEVSGQLIMIIHYSDKKNIYVDFHLKCFLEEAGEDYRSWTMLE